MINATQNKAKSGSSGEIDINRVIGELVDNWKIIMVTCAIFTILSVVYVIFATPIYKTNSLLQIEQKQGNAILDSLNQILPDSQPISAPEISIIQSNMIASKTVSDLNLQAAIQPDYFPFFGRGWARITGHKEGSLDISKIYLDGSTTKNPKKMILTVLDNQHYQINLDDKIINGVVGNEVTAPGINLLVDKIEANKGDKFVVRYLTKLRAANEVLKNLDVSDQGKDSGILRVSFTGDNPNRIEKILNTINANYVAQNVDRQAAQDSRSLEFLNRELPKVRDDLDQAEDKLNEYRKRKDSVDLSLEAKSALEQLVNADNQLNELTFKEAEISQLYTKEHPTYKSLLEKRKVLQDEEAQLNKKISAMPATQQGVLKLSRDVESGRAVYMQLLSRQQELNIAKSSAIGNVRIIDPAITSIDPVKPNAILVVLTGMVLGMVLSGAIVVFKSVLRKGISSPQQLEDEGINVYASVPKSSWLNKLGKNNLQTYKFLAKENPADLAIEAIRSLRTSLHFAMESAKNNILMISGATENAGKTFISTNLAALASQAGRKVIIIDADMRKGTAHKVLGIEAKYGLSDVLNGSKDPAEVIIKIKDSDFDFIPRGNIPLNPSELLMSKRLGKILNELKNEYSLVIVDTPPVLSVTDAEIISTYCGVNLLVVRHEENTIREVLLSKMRFERSGGSLTGCVLNGIERQSSRYGYSYGYYGYKYSEETKK
ncbi:polysaccharide biosynthesis tyrosine autokinase [Erwiniaceae bacterium L1_54_6]|nr:polysaccharide biosynthesis tyrosine autokinase [Erwiniaceae bacterium L1_54_6]